MYKYLFLIFFILSCGKEKPMEATSDTSALRSKSGQYLALGENRGIVDGCDSLLFSSLGAASGLKINVYDFEKAPGVWVRNAEINCFPEHSASSMSKDMLLGLMIYLESAQDQNALIRLWENYEDKNFIICDAVDEATKQSRCNINGSDLQYLLGEASGKRNNPARIFSYGDLKEGYEAHLEVLKIYLSYLIYDFIYETDRLHLKKYCAKQGDNALFCALAAKFDDGDYSKALATLENQVYFPANRLPSSKDRCEPYLWQRDQMSLDWIPCEEEGKTHDGIDLLLASKIILE